MGAANILVVEDEKIIAKGIERRLKSLGYAVSGLLGSGEEALGQFDELRPDLVLMDINLGDGIDGIETASRLQHRYDVPVIFLTAFSDDVTLQRAKLTGPHGYILKPYEDKDLQTAIEIGLYRHQMERRVREHQQWLHSTLASINDAVLATDADGRVRFLNPLAARMTHWQFDEAAGKPLTEVLRLVDETTRQDLTAALPTLDRQLPPSPALLLGSNGSERPVEWHAAPILGGAGRQLLGIVLVWRDIGERRQLELHLRQAQRMEAIGRLAGGIAHDFNNIMTVITGLTELLQGDPQLSDVQQDYLQGIQKAGDRAAALTRQIMAFGRNQLLVPRVMDLNAVVQDMAAMARRLIGANIQLHTELAPNLRSIQADPTQIGQIVLNLATNARDALPRGGSIRITTANTRVDERVPGVLEPGRYAELRVADDGQGIAPEVLPHIFEPFFTTKEIGQGTGLGLATVYGIVKQSGGHIEVHSVPGGGTTFRILLPQVEQPLPRAEVPAERQSRRGRETVLLAEDEEMVRMLTRISLERDGYRVLEAEDGRAALALVASSNERIDLLLTDLMMPHVGGRELAESLLASGRVRRVLFMSGFYDDLESLGNIAADAYDLQPKPFAQHDLLLKVRAMLDGLHDHH